MTLGHVLLAINLIALAFSKRETTETDNMVAAE